MPEDHALAHAVSRALERADLRYQVLTYSEAEGVAIELREEEDGEENPTDWTGEVEQIKAALAGFQVDWDPEIDDAVHVTRRPNPVENTP